MKEIDPARTNPAGRPLTKAGMICGMIGTITDFVGIEISMKFSYYGPSSVYECFRKG
jgi:hypothetical protein